MAPARARSGEPSRRERRATIRDPLVLPAWGTPDRLPEHVCAVSTMGARRDGVDVQTRVVHVFRYQQGQQVERWLYPDDQVAWDSIFGR
jgi:hypothetical protein